MKNPQIKFEDVYFMLQKTGRIPMDIDKFRDLMEDIWANIEENPESRRTILYKIQRLSRSRL